MKENQAKIIINLQLWKSEFPFYINEPVTFYKSDKLKKGIKTYFQSKGMRERAIFKYIYLKKDDKIIGILDPKKSINQIPNGGEYLIFLSKKKYKIKSEQSEPEEHKEVIPNKNEIKRNQTYIPTTPTEPTTDRMVKKVKEIILKINIKKEKFNKKILFLLISFLVILVILTTSLLLIFLSNKKQEDKNYEKLMANIVYRPGEIYIFNNKRNTEVKTEGENIKEENSTTEFSELKNYILMINNEFEEFSNNETRLYYRGIFAIINSYLNNGTHLILSQSKDKIIDILGEKNNLNIESEDNENFIDYSMRNDSSITNPFFMFDFYRNGKIKKIFIPQGFNLSKMIEMKFLLNLTIPKKSLDYFVTDVDEEINKFLENKKKEELDEEYNDTYNENISEIEDSLRGLNVEEQGQFSNKTSINSNYKGDEDVNFDLMQSNTYTSEKNETINEIKELNYGNLNDELYSFEGSELNSTIIFIINENTGKLEYINQKEELILSNQTENEPSEEDIVYDDNNEIKYTDISENMTTRNPDFNLLLLLLIE